MLFGYARVSTLEQAADDRTSLQEQERVIRGMAMAMGIGQFDLQIFTDAGVSARIPFTQRPAGRELYDLAKRGDTVVGSKLDRLFRDALDAQYVYKNFKDAGIDLILYDMGNEPVTRDGMSKFFFSMLSAFADLERNRIAERMKEGKNAKAAKLGYVGGQAPYGYKIQGEGRAAVIVPDEAEMKVIDAIRSSERRSPMRVAEDLKEAGYLNRNGKPFLHVQVQRLRNRAPVDVAQQ